MNPKPETRNPKLLWTPVDPYHWRADTGHKVCVTYTRAEPVYTAWPPPPGHWTAIGYFPTLEAAQAACDRHASGMPSAGESAAKSGLKSS